MLLNVVAFNYHPYDGYGRYATHLVRALDRLGADVTPIVAQQLDLATWMQRMAGLDLSHLTLTCMPPFSLRPLPRQWSLTMTEGTRLPEGWAQRLNECCERVIVPCEHNATAFRASGVKVPVHVIPGGTSPEEFPVLQRRPRRPYTFLTLADRGSRKGWMEVWSAFFKAFSEAPDVRLIVKSRPGANSLLDLIANAQHRDPRVAFWRADVGHPADVYAAADCVALPSRSEGWGMPHREAAMMGMPVITTRYSGLDDGHTQDWAIVVKQHTLHDVPAMAQYVRGQWCRADVEELAQQMRWCYDHPAQAQQRGWQAAAWLRANQTWEHSARALLELIERHG